MPIAYAALILKEKIQDVIDSTEWKMFETPLTMEKGIELRSSLLIATQKCDKMREILLKDGEPRIDFPNLLQEERIFGSYNISGEPK